MRLSDLSIYVLIINCSTIALPTDNSPLLMSTVVPRKDRTTYVGARVPDGLLEKVDRIVDTTEEYSSRSDFILCALRDLARHYDDLHTNGIESERKQGKEL